MKGRIDRLVSVRTLRERFEYDPVSGSLTHKFRIGDTPGEKMFNTRYAGTIVQTQKIDDHGYHRVRVSNERGEGGQVRVHRIAWALQTGEWPSFDIDHRNGDKTDIAFENLRPATRSQNCMNKSPRSDNKVGFKGVCLTSRGGKRFMAQIQVRGRKIHLGEFTDPAEAARAYDAAAIQHHGDFARTNAAMGLL